MTREIKFRAYDTRLKKMVETGFHLIGEVTVFDLISQHFEPMDGLTSVERLNDCEVMQFTGLLDRNGKEIYEGDILNATLVLGRLGCIGVVKYLASQFLVDFTVGGGNRIPTLWERIGYGTDCVGDEVIGNIWENPDLLEAKR